MGLRKLFKKARKALHLPALTLGNVAKVGLAAAGGGIPAVGALVIKSKLKSAAVGGIKRVLRTKAEKALAKRVHDMTPQGPTNPPAQTMPGGAPLAAAARAVRTARGTHSRRRRKSVSVAPSKPARAKRRPPKGGKDFKALSASWKAAGKPGRWIDWVKSH
jgi:hypothetical protein